MNILDQTRPEQKYFEEISRIPRNSREEKAVSDYVVQNAARLGLTAVQDEPGNMIVKKPASAGYENAPSVMEEDFPHPALELVFTVQEEDGCFGRVYEFLKELPGEPGE